MLNFICIIGFSLFPIMSPLALQYDPCLTQSQSKAFNQTIS